MHFLQKQSDYFSNDPRMYNTYEYILRVDVRTFRGNTTKFINSSDLINQSNQCMRIVKIDWTDCDYCPRNIRVHAKPHHLYNITYKRYCLT